MEYTWWYSIESSMSETIATFLIPDCMFGFIFADCQTNRIVKSVRQNSQPGHTALETEAVLPIVMLLSRSGLKNPSRRAVVAAARGAGRLPERGTSAH